MAKVHPPAPTATVNNLTGGKEPGIIFTGTEETQPPVPPSPPVPDSIMTFSTTRYTVWCPQDTCLTPREIEANSPAQAKEKYMEEMGIITVGHPLSASEV